MRLLQRAIHAAKVVRPQRVKHVVCERHHGRAQGARRQLLAAHREAQRAARRGVKHRKVEQPRRHEARKALVRAPKGGAPGRHVRHHKAHRRRRALAALQRPQVQQLAQHQKGQPPVPRAQLQHVEAGGGRGGAAGGRRRQPVPQKPHDHARVAGRHKRVGGHEKGQLAVAPNGHARALVKSVLQRPQRR